MKYFVFNFFLILLLFSCKKAQDKIFHKKLNPTQLIEVEYDTIYNLPKSIDTSLFIDINLDGKLDLKFQFETYLDCSGTGPSDCFKNRKIRVFNENDDFSVAVDEDNTTFCEKIDLNEKISRKLTYKQSAVIYVSQHIGQSYSEWYYTDLNGESYVAFKFKNHYYGWMKIRCNNGSFGFEIVEYAYNKNPNNNILAGQIE